MDISVYVNYMGILAEKAGTAEEVFNQRGLKSVIIKTILEKHPEFSKFSFVVSHNGVIRHDDVEVCSGDHLTLIPPPPGG